MNAAPMRIQGAPGTRMPPLSAKLIGLLTSPYSSFDTTLILMLALMAELTGSASSEA